MELIGIIGAMEEEVLTLKEKMNIHDVRSIASLEFFIGDLKNRKIVVVQAGIGKVNAAVCTQIMIDIFRVDAIINTGVAGGLADELEIGDVVISRDAMQHDFNASGFGYKIGQIPRMDTSTFVADEHLVKIAEKASDILSAKVQVFTDRIVSGDIFISDPKKKEDIVKHFNAFCTEMEGAAIAQTCYLNRKPFVIIRSISDKADQSAEVNFAEFTKMAALNSCKMIERMLELI